MRRWVGLIAVGLLLAVDPWLSQGMLLPAPPLNAFIGNLVVLVTFAVLAWSGVGAVSWWTLKVAFRQFPVATRMTSRALPLLILVIIFAFYSPEVWQMADDLSNTDVVLSVAVFMALGLVFVLPNAGRHARQLDQQMSPARRRALFRLAGMRSFGVSRTAQVRRFDPWNTSTSG